MSRRERFHPIRERNACLDYINGNRSDLRYVIVSIFPQETIQD